MKFLLVGLGFISTHVALELSRDQSVTVTFNSVNPVKEEYLALIKSKANAVKANPLSEEMGKLIKEHDVVVNFVGEISGGEDKLRTANIEIPKTLAKRSFEEGKMFVHLSGATSTGITGKNVREETEHCKGAQPKTPFERSKCEGERAVMSEALERDGSVAILRPTLVYGRYAVHVQFVTMYKLAKRRIIPDLNLNMATVNAWSIGRVIRTLGEKMPRRVIVYASECGSVKVSDFFRLMAKRLGGGISIPVPVGLAKAFLPSEIRSLLRYAGTTYDCTAFRELGGGETFDSEEVEMNAEFLKLLDHKGKLIPT
ncbi:NAD-dependent epimerase/dehydratase family protein [Metallosphaera tengchongensis]|uniref:NAD-dependent epimerase/dehydratase family protein n=1 Tax=Metallosphaera tengchongensis TaxID=1532350 RepID=A0A6N0NTP5_9CREN|nr:NAD-dependent epimerase/dehydratase family protein [Metallosphaera tengchongensis]QKR00146.1 NAD-dependent epimerase/dehydratase family protein [Metallosphaera tengchongensis]